MTKLKPPIEGGFVFWGISPKNSYHLLEPQDLFCNKRD